MDEKELRTKIDDFIDGLVKHIIVNGEGLSDDNRRQIRILIDASEKMLNIDETLKRVKNIKEAYTKYKTGLD